MYVDGDSNVYELGFMAHPGSTPRRTILAPALLALEMRTLGVHPPAVPLSKATGNVALEK